MRCLLSVLLSIGGSPALVAQLHDIPVTNWTVPPYTTSSGGGGFTTMGGGAPAPAPRAFTPTPPCRIVDTRLASFPAGFGPPALSPGVARVFDLNNGPCPGLPFLIDAYSLNITVVTPAGAGHLIIWPYQEIEPSVSSINYTAGQTIANAVIVQAGTDGRVSVKAGVSGTHLLIDVNGYFSLIAPLPFTLRSELTSGSAIRGEIPQGGNNSSGVFGSQGGAGGALVGTYGGAGVRGHGLGYGVLGVSGLEAVGGSLLSGATEIAYGSLGLAVGTDPNCIGGGACGGPWGVFAGGNIGATGTKHFLDPHPGDAGLTIAYVSLEGPEAGTYFRGRGKFQNGIARIPVPEHFRLVTDPEGLTVQVTPVGPMATFSVMKVDLNEIVVQASRNVEFFYLVQGVRASFKDLAPVRRSGEFMPRTADARMPDWLSPAQKRALIKNGTYREDGTVNVETARRLGWDRIWRERESPSPAPAAD